MVFGGVYYVQSSNLHRLVFVVAFFSLEVVMSISNCVVAVFSEFFASCLWDLDCTTHFLLKQKY